jgi:hypothetical protein
VNSGIGPALIQLARTLSIVGTGIIPGSLADCPYPLLNKPYRQDELAWALREVFESPDCIRHAPELENSWSG